MIDRSLFTHAFQSTMGKEDFDEFIKTAEKVPFLEAALNEYLSKGGSITTGPSGEGTYCSGPRIVFEEYIVNGSRRLEDHYFETICLTLGHEVAHGLDEDLKLEDSAPNPVASSKYGLASEGKALETEYRISKALGIPLREDGAILEAITKEKGLSLESPEPERIKRAAEIYSKYTPSGTIGMTYETWYPVQDALGRCGVRLTHFQQANIKPEDFQLHVDEKDPTSWRITAAKLPSDPNAPWACTKLHAEFNAKGPISIQAETDLPEMQPVNLKNFHVCRTLLQNVSKVIEVTPEQWRNLKEGDIIVEESRSPVITSVFDYLRQVSNPNSRLSDNYTQTLKMKLSDDPESGLYWKEVELTVNARGRLVSGYAESNAEHLSYEETRNIQEKLEACGVILKADQWAQLKPEDVTISGDEKNWTFEAKFPDDSNPPFYCKSVKAHHDSEGHLVVEAESSLPNVTDYAQCRALQKLEEFGLKLTQFQWDNLDPRHVHVNPDKSVSGVLPFDPDAPFQFYGFRSSTDMPPGVIMQYLDREHNEGLTSQAAIRVVHDGATFRQGETKDNWKTLEKKTVAKPDFSDRFDGTINPTLQGDLFEKWLQGNPEMTPEVREQFEKNFVLIDALLSNKFFQTKTPELDEIGKTYLKQTEEIRAVRREEMLKHLPEEEVKKKFLESYMSAQNQARSAIQEVQKKQAVANGLVARDSDEVQESSATNSLASM